MNAAHALLAGSVREDVGSCVMNDARWPSVRVIVIADDVRDV
jgi:hypothetical protein